MTDNHFKINEAIKIVLKSKKTQTGLVRIAHGAQFSSVGAVGAWFLMMFILIIAVVLIIQGMLFYSIPLFLFCVLIVAYAMDYQGVEFDFKSGKVRNYNSFLGIRFGYWYILKNFNRLKIYQDSLSISRVMGSASSSSRAFDTHHYYGLYLIDDDGSPLIKLYEDESVTKVKVLAAKFSKISELEFMDKINKKTTEVIGKNSIL